MLEHMSRVDPEQRDTHETHDVPDLDRAETHERDGVDVTLIRWMLSLTPEQRLRVLEDQVRSILRLRGENPHL